MKFNKIIAAASVVAMMGSLAVAVPASAKTIEKEETLNVSTAAVVRAKNNEGWGARQSVAIKSGEETIEMTRSKSGDPTVYYFGAFYDFDLNLPEGATVANATLTVKKGVSFKGVKTLDVYPVSIETVDLNNIWTAVSSMMTAADAPATVTAGDASGDDVSTYLAADVTSLVQSGADAFFIYNTDDNGGNRTLTAAATLSVAYSYEEVDDPVAQIGEKKYATLDEAVKDAANNDTITLLEDVDVSGARLTIGENLTIESDGKTITVRKDQSTGGILLNQNRTLTFNNTNIATIDGTGNAVAVENGKLVINGGTIDGNVYINKNIASAVLTGVTVNGSIVKGGNADGCSAVIGEGTTITGTNAFAPVVEPETRTEYFVVNGDKVSFNTVTVTATKGTVTKTGSTTLDTTVSGEGSVYLAITEIGEDVMINSVTVE